MFGLEGTCRRGSSLGVVLSLQHTCLLLLTRLIPILNPTTQTTVEIEYLSPPVC